MVTDNRHEFAQRLRMNGHSIKSIAKQVGAAQSSVSIWCRNVKLTSEQSHKLKLKSHTRIVIEKRRQSRLKSEKIKRDLLIKSAAETIQIVDDYNLKLVVAALYWAEGAKKSGIFQFTNGDPRMIKLVLHFLRNTCDVEESKLRAYIHIHESLDVQAAEAYWQKITNIAPKQFYKTYNKKNISSKGKRTSLPYGVCDIYVMDAKLFYQIQGWIEGMYTTLLR